jgi:hypothetical protein
LQLQSQGIDEIIGILGYLMGRYLHLFTWWSIDEIVAETEFQSSLPLGRYRLTIDCEVGDIYIFL